MKNWKNVKIDNISGEIWKNIPLYEGLYMASNMGRIKRLKSKNCLKDRILRQTIGGGYCRVAFSKNSEIKYKSVHIIVAEVFIPNPKKLPIVCHKDDDPTNNCVSNLWRGTQSDNIKDCHKKGRASNNLPKMEGKSHPMFGKKMRHSVKKKMSDSKKMISDVQISSAKNMYLKGHTLRESGNKYGISYSYLSQLINGGYKRL